MKLLKEQKVGCLSFEIVKTDIERVFLEDLFTVTLRITNNSKEEKNVRLNTSYTSVIYGLKNNGITEPRDIVYSEGVDLLPSSFVDAKIPFEGIESAIEGDRMRIEINKEICLLLKLNNGEWYVTKKSDISSAILNLKSLISHDQALESKFGLLLQNFSVQVVNKSTIKLFCEVIETDSKKNRGFDIQVAIYDKDNNIVDLSGEMRYKNSFSGFEVLSFDERKLPIPVKEIGKILFYPTSI